MLPFIVYFGAYLSLMGLLFALYKNADKIENLLNSMSK